MAPTAPVRYKIRRDAQGYWRWRALGNNYEIVANGEAYFNKADCIHAINLLKGSGNAPISEE